MVERINHVLEKFRSSYFDEKELNRVLYPEAYAVILREPEPEIYSGSIDYEKRYKDAKIILSEKNYTGGKRNILGVFSPYSNQVVIRKESIKNMLKEEWNEILKDGYISFLQYKFYDLYDEKQKIDLERATNDVSEFTLKHELGHYNLYQEDIVKYDATKIVPKKYENSIGEFFDTLSEVAADTHPKGPIMFVLKNKNMNRDKKIGLLSRYTYDVLSQADPNYERLMSPYIKKISGFKTEPDYTLKRLPDTVKEINENIDYFLEKSQKYIKENKTWKIMREIEKTFPFDREFQRAKQVLLS